MPEEEFSVEISEAVAADDPADRYRLIEYIPASARRLSKMEWTYVRPGGCGEFKCELALPYDHYGLDFRARAIQQFNHLVLRVGGRVWWCGTVEAIAPKLATPETVTLTAKGYAFQAEKATLSWSFTRQSMKTAGAIVGVSGEVLRHIGDIPGVVRSMYLLMPLLFGTEQGFPHPLADTFRVDGSAVRPRALIFDQVSLWEVFTELATLAGNYDWGVDANRQFYFVSPQTLSAGTSLYTDDPAVSVWSPNLATSRYGDESYANPQAVPPYLPVEENAHFVLGHDVSAYDSNQSVQGSKNTLIIIAAPKKVDGPPTLVTVADSEWLDYWKRRLTARVATAFFSEEEDVRRWGQQRLKLLGRPQVSGGVKAIYLRRNPILPLGALRYIDPDKGIEVVERLLSVKYHIDKNDQLEVQVDVGYQPPADQYFAEQLRRDATLSQNTLVGERVPFILGERMLWASDHGSGGPIWDAVLS